MKRKLTTVFILLILWQMASWMIQKEVILPFPGDVLMRMGSYLFDKPFYIAIFYTMIRILISFVVAMLVGITLGIFSGLYSSFRHYLQPIMTLLQTIPQIGYMLILLVWVDSDLSLLLIIFFMLMPIFYFNTMHGMMHIDSDLQDIITLYHHPLYYNLRYAYLPLIKGYILSAVETCLPLSFKVGVMAEVFVSAQHGIGKQLYLARVQIDMIGIFAWILWMVIIVWMLTKFSTLIMGWIQNKNKK